MILSRSRLRLSENIKSFTCLQQRFYDYAIYLKPAKTRRSESSVSYILLVIFSVLHVLVSSVKSVTGKSANLSNFEGGRRLLQRVSYHTILCIGDSIINDSGKCAPAANCRLNNAVRDLDRPNGHWCVQMNAMPTHAFFEQRRDSARISTTEP